MSDHTLIQEMENLRDSVHPFDTACGAKRFMVEECIEIAKAHSPSEIPENYHQMFTDIYNFLAKTPDLKDWHALAKTALGNDIIAIIQPHLREPKQEAQPAGEIPIIDERQPARELWLATAQDKQVCEYCKAYPGRIGNNECNICNPKREAQPAGEIPDNDALIQIMLDAYENAGNSLVGTLPDVGMEAALNAVLPYLKRQAQPAGEIPVNKPVCLPQNSDKKVCLSEDADLEDVSKIVHCVDCGKRLCAEEILYLTNTCNDCESKAWDGVLHEGEEKPAPARDKAYGYAYRLFKHLAPQCTPLPDTLGILTQLDNYIAGLRATKREISGRSLELLRNLMRRLDGHFGKTHDWKEQEEARNFLNSIKDRSPG